RDRAYRRVRNRRRGEDSRIAMTNPELEDKTVRIIREVEAYRSATARRRSSSTWNNDNSSGRHKHAGQILNSRVEIRRVEMTLILLVHVTAISRANSPPAGWIDSDTAKGVHRIIVECIRRPAACVHRRTYFADQLDVLVDRVVKSQS